MKLLFKIIKEEVANRWIGINFSENILLVLTVPVEY